MNTETTLIYETPADVEFCSAADAAREISCHPSSVKRVARELRLAVFKTKGGIHLFTGQQVEKIRLELERRSLEALRR